MRKGGKKMEGKEFIKIVENIKQTPEEIERLNKILYDSKKGNYQFTI